MNKGYYRLTADVKNPRPDRRSKRLAAREVWPAGTQVYITDRRDIILHYSPEAMPAGLGEIRFPDGSQIDYDLGAKDTKYAQGNALVALVEPAPKTLGQVLAQADWRAEDLLAMLIDAGKISVEDVDEVKNKDLTPEASGNDWQVRDAAAQAFQARHGIA